LVRSYPHYYLDNSEPLAYTLINQGRTFNKKE